MDKYVRDIGVGSLLLVQEAGARPTVEAFRGTGLTVRGPVATLADVESAVAAGDVAHAVIDAALDEDLAMRIVALLARRGVPWLVLAA